MKTIAIFSKNNKKNNNVINNIINEIKKYNGNIIIFNDLKDVFKDIDGTFCNNKELENVDFLLSVGGDGTFLSAITYVRNSNIPILGFNIGRLGFLSNVDLEQIGKAIKAVFNGEYNISSRTLLNLKSISNLNLPELNFAINDITVSKKDTNSMITIHAFIDNLDLNTYWADGLIVATPTGSTAYSLSCSGPIITPNSNNFIINPIAPHNLSIRPLIIPDISKIKLIVESRDDIFNLTLDSRTYSVKSNSEILIEKEKFNIKIASLHGDCFFKIIRNKLNWGSDYRN